MIRRASAVITPIASIAARSSRRPSPAETGCSPRSGSPTSRRRSAHSSRRRDGALRILQAVRAGPPAEAALVLGLARREQHAIGDLLHDRRETLVRRLAADAEALADLLPRRRRGALGGDREPQHLLGLAHEPRRVLDKLAAAAVPVAVGRDLSAGGVAELLAGDQVGDAVQLGVRVCHRVKVVLTSDGRQGQPDKSCSCSIGLRARPARRRALGRRTVRAAGRVGAAPRRHQRQPRPRVATNIKRWIPRRR